MALLLCSGALAASEPVVGSIELSPAFLAGPGTVNVTIVVSNATNEDFKDPVILYNPAAQVVADFGDNGQAMLKAGESLTWTGSYEVNQRTLDNGYVMFYLKYTNYSESGKALEQSLSLRATITKQTAEAALSVERTISPGVAQEGQEIKVVYHITNAGTVALTNIKISENKDIYDKTQTIPELDAGLTADVTYPVTMGKKNLTSGATITYTTNEGEEKKYVVEDQTITYGTSDLEAKLTSSSKGVVKDSVFTLTLKLKNAGSVDYSDIRVSDPILGEVFSNQKLEAGKSLTLEKEVTLTATTTYQFSITSIDSTGTETVTGTDAVTVTAVNAEDALNLSLVASADQYEAYGDPAKVRFSVTITNDSNVEAAKVVLLHGDVELQTFDAIGAGQSRVVTRDTALSNSGKYQFTVTAQDPLENDMTFKSNELQIAIYAPTPVPTTPTPAPNPTPEPTFNPATVIPIRDESIGTVPKAVQGVLLPLLIIAGVLLVGTCVLLIVATQRRHSQKKASEAAYDHLERAKRRDYVTPAQEEEPETKTEEDTSERESENDKLMANRRIIGDDQNDDWELPHVKYARDAAQTDAAEKGGGLSMGEGLYDEEMTSDFSGFALSHDDPEQQDDVLYEQPYESAEMDGYTEDLADSDSTGETTQMENEERYENPDAPSYTLHNYDDVGYDPDQYDDPAYQQEQTEYDQPYTEGYDQQYAGEYDQQNAQEANQPYADGEEQTEEGDDGAAGSPRRRSRQKRS